MPEPHQLLARLTRGLARTESRAPMPVRLCLAFSSIVGGDGGAITLGFSLPERVTLCATDDPAARVEEAQDLVREGPSLDAFRTGAPVSGLSPSEHRLRWPLLAELLAGGDSGLTVHSFPLRPDAEVVGVMSVYQADQRGLILPVPDAQFLANAVAVALLGHLEASPLTDEGWAARDAIDQATGMVIAQLRVAPADALAVLRAHAFAHSSTLGAVSAWVLDRELDFSDTESSDGMPS